MLKKDIKFFDIEPFNPHGVRPPVLPPWDEAMQHAGFTVNMPPDRITEGRDLAITCVEGAFTLALHWVYKLKWNPRHRIPDPRTRKIRIRSYKPYAEVLLAWMNLCAELHLLGYGAGYPNAGEWWKTICWEHHRDILFSIFNEDFQGTIWDRGAKRELSAKLHRGVNPFDPITHPAQWEVAEAVTQIRHSHPTIFQGLWRGTQRQTPHKGLCAALTAWENADTGAGFAIIDGKMTQRDKSGRRQTLVAKSDR